MYKELFFLGLVIGFISMPLNAQSQKSPIVIKGQYIDISPPLSTMKLVLPTKKDSLEKREVPNPSLDILPDPNGLRRSSSVATVQDYFGSRPSITPATSFEGASKVSQGFGVAPADTDGDIGPNHYVQMVNNAFQIFNRAGTTLYGPAALGTIWQGLPAPFTNGNKGDPIVLYDEIADRWLLSEFAFQNFSTPPYHILVAVSATNDPLGSYHRYAFDFSTVGFPDYPKLSVWSDGYYMSLNVFDPNFIGASAVVLQRDSMLVGAAADMIVFPPDVQYFSLLPADVDGPLPPLGSSNTFAQLGFPAASLEMFEFTTDWAVPANSTFIKSVIPVSLHDDACFNCISQPGGLTLRSLSGRLMFPLKYRNMGTHESLVANHTIEVGNGSNQAGIRWYELRRSGGGPWSLHQEGTYAPDSENRFMGSIAMNSYGDIMLGYSVSSANVFPSIRFTGRLASDSLNIMTIDESIIIAGTGVQTGTSRWGDYSAMSVDPVDDRSFWYTNEYVETTGSFNWQTRIAKVELPPAVSLSISMTTTTENSMIPIIYSFERIGNTDAPLTVHFSLAGTAIKDSDFDLIGQATFDAMNSKGTITILMGASSADLTVTPIGDIDIEPDESVIIKIESN